MLTDLSTDFLTDHLDRYAMALLKTRKEVEEEERETEKEKKAAAVERALEEKKARGGRRSKNNTAPSSPPHHHIPEMTDEERNQEFVRQLWVELVEILDG